MAEAEQVYSTAQVAEALKIVPAMVRRYAVTYEKLVGREIPMKRRDGRQFSPAHFETLSKAKVLVDANNGLSVETALKMVLGQGEGSEALQPSLSTAPVDTQALATAIGAAIAEANKPILAKLEELRLEMAEGRQLADTRNSAQLVEKSAQVADKPHGLLVWLAMRIERIFKS